MRLFAENTIEGLKLDKNIMEGPQVVTKDYEEETGTFFGINNGINTVILSDIELNQFTGISNTKESLNSLSSEYTVVERTF